MSRLRYVAFLSVLVASLGAVRPSCAAEPAAGDRGRRLFDVHCSRCHGIGGGGGEGPPLTQPVLRRAPDDATLVTVIQQGIPRTPMTGSFALSDAEAGEVAAYVRSLGRAASASPPTGDPALGRAVYDENGCGACHIVAGEGRGIGPELTAIGTVRGVEHLRQSLVDAAEVVTEEFRLVAVRTADGAPVRGLRVNQDDAALLVRDADGRLHSFHVEDLTSLRLEMGESLMPSYGGRLSREEIENLVAYLAGLRGGKE